jgi:hypothetical protein
MRRSVAMERGIKFWGEEEMKPRYSGEVGRSESAVQMLGA